MPVVVLDENTSLEVGTRLAACGYEVVAVAKMPGRGASDESVFALASGRGALLVTRDAHFTNPIRFPPSRVGGILFIAHGNLTARQEGDLIEGFLRTHGPEGFQGRLVSLSPSGARVR